MIRIPVVTLLILLANSFYQQLASAERPNIILILADDLGFECVGANGGTSYSTPRLDQLAATGARFEHCYAQPLCTPTRIQLMTGQSNVRNYVRFGWLPPDSLTFAHLFRNAGYRTGIFGKWQLENGFEGPGHFGFDDYCLWQLTRRPPRYANPGLEMNGRQIDFSNGEYGPDLVQQHALHFIQQNREKPFLLYYPMMLTHAPFQPTPDSPDWDPQANGEQANQHERHFGEMVTYMDKLVGQLVDQLDAMSLRERTLILFVGDNGTAAKVTSKWRGQSVVGAKKSTTDAGMRVPMFANWPNQIRPSVIQDLVDTTDFLPTICDAASISISPDRVIDGRSFLPQLRGESGNPREWLYVWFAPNQQERQDVPIVFARNHQFKLFDDGRFVKLDGRYGETAIDSQMIDTNTASVKSSLQAVLDRYQNARPPGLDRKTP